MNSALRALGDLIDLYDYIVIHDGAERAIGYIDRMRIFAAVFRCSRTVVKGETICVWVYGLSASNAVL